MEGWDDALAVGRERVGPARRFLLGFSNGGYFAGLDRVARPARSSTRWSWPTAAPSNRCIRFGAAPPLLLLSADDDVAQDEMIRLDEELAREHWAHDSYARAGGHALTDQDIDAALTFFARSGEALPLRPPLPLHRAVRHARDAGDDAEVPAQTPPDTPPPDTASPPAPAPQDDAGGGDAATQEAVPAVHELDEDTDAGALRGQAAQ